jgi:hypothetical protein
MARRRVLKVSTGRRRRPVGPERSSARARTRRTRVPSIGRRRRGGMMPDVAATPDLVGPGEPGALPGI